MYMGLPEIYGRISYRTRVYTRELQGTRFILSRLKLPDFVLESFIYFLTSAKRASRSVTIRATCTFLPNLPSTIPKRIQIWYH